MTTFSKIARGVSSNVYAQIVTIVTQLVTLPIALLFWDLDTYGRWVLLTAVPAYFGMAELGMGTAAANLAINAIARGNQQAASAYLGSANYAAMFVCGALFLLTLAIVPLLLFLGGLDLEGAVVLALVAATNLISVAMSVNEAAFKAADKYATGTVITTTSRFFEWLGFLIAMVFNAEFETAAFFMLVTRILALIFQIAYLERKIPYIGWSCKMHGPSTVREILRPALQLSVFPLASLISIQGVTLAVGWAYGLAAAGIFGAYRTYSRISLQAVTIVSNPLLNWLTISVANRQFSEAEKAYKAAMTFSALICLVLPIVLFMSAQPIFEFWTHGKISVDSGLLIAFLAWSLFAALYSIPRSMLIALNRPGELNRAILIISALQILAVLIFSRFYPVISVAIVMLLGDALIAIAACSRASSSLRAVQTAA